MWSPEQKKGLAIAVAGHGLYLASRYLAGGAAPSAAVHVGGALASLLMIYGSALYVRGKGYAAAWGIGGFLPFVGLGTLMLIPAFPGAEEPEPPAPEKPAPEPPAPEKPAPEKP